MTFKDYHSEAWKIHQDQTQKVYSEFEQNFSLAQTTEEITSLGNLILHVTGEHLGKWQDGIALIEKLKAIKKIENTADLDRYVAILKISEDKNHSLLGFSDSDQARILAISASALASQNDIARAGKYLKKANLVVQEKLTGIDPAMKALAITGWNLACGLEEKAELSNEEAELIKLSAHISRDNWEKVGTWLDVEQCEYRLAKAYLKTNDPSAAKKHADTCLSIIKKNADEPYEYFYAYEVQALCEKALGNQLNVEKNIHEMEQYFARLSPDVQTSTKATLDKVKAL